MRVVPAENLTPAAHFIGLMIVAAEVRRSNGLLNSAAVIFKSSVFCLLFLLLAQPHSLHAGEDSLAHLRTTRTDEYQVTYWTSEQGLPQNTVNDVLQSHDGYLWIATRYGLARYDGVRFTDYTPELSAVGAETLNVSKLAEDSQGGLWLLGRNSVTLMQHGRFRSFTLEGAPFQGELRRMSLDPRGGMWITRGEGLFHFQEGRIGKSFQLGNGHDIAGVIADPNGALWVETSMSPRFSAWHRLDPVTGTVWSITNVLDQLESRIGGLWPDPDGSIWFAKPKELVRWQAGELTRYDASHAWGQDPVKGMVRDREGTFWIMSDGPAQLHRFAQGLFTSYGREQGLFSLEDVRCVYPDREGNLWTGTGGGGLSRMQPRQLVSVLGRSLSAMDEVYSISPGQNGRVWLATTYGLVQYQDGQFTTFTNASAFGASGEVLKRLRVAFEHSSGQVFCGLDFDGLCAFDGREFRLLGGIEPLYAERRLVTGLAEDARGTLWIASQRGLGERRGNECKLWTTKDGLSDERTVGLACAPDGSVWVGTQDGGVNQLRAGRFRTYTVRDGLLSQNAWPLRAEPDGSVWVGTPVGLNRIRGGEVRSLTMREGLADNLAYCLLEDRRGNYWSFGNRGIWRVRKDELHAAADHKLSRVNCLIYGEADGLPSVEGNGDEQPNAVALPNGELWFPMTRGVVIVNPEAMRENRIPPRVVIEEVLIDGEPIYQDGGYTLPQHFLKAEGKALRVPPGRAKVLEVRYTATTLMDSDKTQFRCRLNGDNQDWHEMDTRRVAVFTNLRPGTYRFEVEARNHHGYRSEKAAEFTLALEPRFVQTWSFYGCCGALASACLGGWRWRRVRIRRHLERLERDRAIETERNRIARDLHDDLGANLTGLAVQIDVALHQLNQPERLRGHLENLSCSARGLVDIMREAVWSINPQCDTLESFCVYVCQYAEKFLRSVGIVCRFDLPQIMPARTFTSETRHHLLLIVKEGLNNAAKYAGATEVHLALSLSGSELILTITDNGCGGVETFPNSSGLETASRAIVPRPAGQGLRNIRQRVEALSGRFEVRSEQALGTCLEVRVPMPTSPTSSVPWNPWLPSK
jgi:signal transduction histidine kinase/ligand-binding sensor domain-containing protein